jgi:DUF4097 and DUF4098 domain-containing protein YvlB
MPDESWVVTGPQVIEVDDVEALRVQLVRGRVDVVAHDGPGARVEVYAVDGRPLEVSLVEGELRVGYTFTLGGWEGWLERFLNFRDQDRADVSIAVPRAARARVGTVSADGLVAGTDGQASVSTVSGALVVDGTRGQLAGNTVSGEIVVRDHMGTLRLNSVSGEVAASGELSSVYANTVSGSVALDVVEGSTSVDATTVSGSVTVRIPDGEGVRVKANSVGGRLVVDGEEHGGGTPGTRTVDLRHGDGGSTVSVKTVNGDVTLLRGAAHPASASGWGGSA